MSSPDEDSADYSGAVYGSLLAGSVVAEASPRRGATDTLTLMGVLLATGVVFWLAHVYARVVGNQVTNGFGGWTQIRAVGHTEWPIVGAALPPAVTAGAGWLLGLADSLTIWLCLLVAIAGQVGWAMAASVRISSSRRYAVVSGVINLLLGLIIIALKTLLAH